MRIKIAMAVVVFFFAAFLGGSLAYAKPMSISEKIESQQRRIDRGIKQGQLTRSEVEMLQGNLDHIRARFNRLRVEDRLTPQNRRELHMMLDQNSDMIHRKKLNPIRRLY